MTEPLNGFTGFGRRDPGFVSASQAMRQAETEARMAQSDPAGAARRARDARAANTHALSQATADLGRAAFGGALDDFAVAEVAPLDAAGLAEFGRRMAERFGAEEGAAALSDEALAYLAEDFAATADEMRNAVRFLLTARGFEAGHVVTADDAREALAS